MHVIWSRQDSLRPFPWSRSSSATPVSDSSAELVIDGPTTSGSSTSPECKVVPNELCARMDFLDYKLPRRCFTAGGVLQHCKSVFESLYRKHNPMTFKIGCTHNVVYRWCNDLFGYQMSKNKFNYTNMVVLHEASDPGSAAMLEAALIDIYKSNLFTIKKNWLSFFAIFVNL